MAHLSKQLATIYCEVPLELSEDALRRHPFNRPALVQLYKELELKSLLKDLDKIMPEAPEGYVTEMAAPADNNNNKNAVLLTYFFHILLYLKWFHTMLVFQSKWKNCLFF